MKIPANRSQSAPAETAKTVLRKPDAQDGMDVWGLIKACPPLDQNSAYCNLLQCTDFAETSILAERDGQVVGWISGYKPPRKPDTLFVWQVAVHEDARGSGLAGRMLSDLLTRRVCEPVSQLQTTITPDNEGSFALFRSFAARMNAPFLEAPGFGKDTHFQGQHDSERLITIGPIPDTTASRKALRSVS